MAETILAAANMRITHDKAVNMAKIVQAVDDAGASGVDILVLPEVALQGYVDLSFGLGDPGAARQLAYYAREAETIPGPATDTLCAKAARYNMIIQLGLAEQSGNGNVIFNATALIGPKGVIGVYRKVHNQFEFPYFNPGEATPVFDLPAGKAGSLICYDLAFPELMRCYALKGAELALMSTAWPMLGHDMSDDYYGRSMDIAAKANAFFNQMWLVISDHCETGAYSSGLDYWGNSQIVDPYGQVVASLGREEGLVIHKADLHQKVIDRRTQGFFGLNLLQDRRPRQYGPLVDLASHAPPSYPAPLWQAAGDTAAGNGDTA